jgi:hypothetical protein
MTVVFQDLQEVNNPLNGRQLKSAASMAELWYDLGGRKPFLFELRGDNGFMLTVGYAGDTGSVQYSSCDGSRPYLLATSDESMEDSTYVEFLAGNTPTPIPRRFCLPIGLLAGIFREFVERGERSGSLAWEEI